MGDVCVQFQSAFYNDNRRPRPLEESVRLALAYAGVHDLDFQDAIGETFEDLDDWTTQAGASWTVSSNQLVAAGSVADEWAQARHDVQVAPSFVAHFSLVSGQGAFLFHGKDSANDCYMAWWTTSTCGFAKVDSGRLATNLVVMPYGIAAPAEITVAVKFMLDSVDGSRKWLLGSMWADGHHYVGFAEDIGGTAYDWDGNAVGFATTDTLTMTVDNFYVPELDRLVEWTIIDPGSTPGMGMARAVSTTRVLYQARYDGTVRVWRPGDRSEDWAIPNSRVLQFQDRSNRASVLTRARMLGAIHQVDAFDDDRGDQFMQRFNIYNNPETMTEGETYAEAWRMLHDEEELQEVARIVLPPNPLVEPQDRVSFDGVDYRVVSTDVDLQMAQGRPQYQGKLELRQYLALGTPPDRS